MKKIVVVEDRINNLAVIVKLLTNARYDVYPIWVYSPYSFDVKSECSKLGHSSENLLVADQLDLISDHILKIVPDLILQDYFLFGSNDKPFSGDDILNNLFFNSDISNKVISISSISPDTWEDFSSFAYKDNLTSYSEPVRTNAVNKLLDLVSSVLES